MPVPREANEGCLPLERPMVAFLIDSALAAGSSSLRLNICSPVKVVFIDAISAEAMSATCIYAVDRLNEAVKKRWWSWRRGGDEAVRK